MTVALAFAMLGAHGSAAAAGAGPSKAGEAGASTRCGLDFAEAFAEAGGPGASANAHARVEPHTTGTSKDARQSSHHAQAVSHATGSGVGSATAWAGAGGVSASASCPLGSELEVAATPALGPSYGCLAQAGAAEATYDGALLVDPLAAAVWLVGSVERGGAASPFAAPALGGLVLTATRATSAAPPGLDDSGLRLRVEFTNAGGDAACRSELTG